jgi:hypothetical protein
VGSAPPPETEALARALALLETGTWQDAHVIVQDERSRLAAWLHGIVHTLEGDLDNARYWYRRARRPFPGPQAVASEIGEARRALAGETSPTEERA